MTSLEKVINILLISFFLVIPLCISLELKTITPRQSLKDGDVLVSVQKKFALGFFSPGNSRYRYVGIWYNKVPQLTVVWVANRDNPINDSSGIMSINGQGTLVIYGYNHTDTPLWSANTSTTSPAKNSAVKLSDEGNLVLVENVNNKVIWQSFNYLSDTMLPGMKIGLNRHSGSSLFLTSWKSENDPGTGTVSYELNPTGYPQFFLYKNGSPLWRAGHWTGKRWSGVPEMTRSFIFNYSFVDNKDEIYITYSIVNNSIFSRMVINETGLVERTTWHDQIHQWSEFWSAPNEKCDNYGQCGPNGYCDPYLSETFSCVCLPGFEPKSPRDWYLRDGSAGCVKKQEVATCQNGEGFVPVSRVKIPDTSIAHVSMGLNLKKCEEMCLTNCSCMAYGNADERGNEIVCLMWYGDLVDSRTYTNFGQDLYVRVDATTLAAYAKRSNSLINYKGKVGISMASVALLLLLLFLVYWFVKAKRKEKETKAQSQNLLNVPMNSPYFEDSIDELPFYDLNTIAAATNNFSDDNKLGEGGFGYVYKGVLYNGKEIAIKRLSKNSGQGIEEFKNEIVLISKLQHRNLVRILGCCVQENEQILIYEYVANKSLDTFIFDETKRIMLDWSKRFDIICGVARGMLYLHHDSRLRIIHRDLKASNILLDDVMNPKIADFGMARIFGANQIEANTMRVVGTYGYMSPEYAMEGLFSIKSDVYSFGVLMIEIITGKKNTGYYHNDNPELNLIGHVWELWREGKVLDIVDSFLHEEFGNQVLRCIQIGLLCVQEHATDRPTMSIVVFMLGNDDSTLPYPKRPAFIVRRSHTSGDPSTTEGSTSINYVTCTVVEAR